jgi:MFS family permease
VPGRPDAAIGSWVDTDVPPRLDALGWSSWHRRVVLALGITWVLDGLESSLVANLAPTLQDPRALGLTAEQIGLANSAYLVGQVLGALGFGHLTDQLGRKRMFVATLGVYLVATAASGLAPNLAVFLVLRMIAGSGIGGEYAAINSAIDELVPARLRGRIDLAINGSYWLGIAAGAILTLVLLSPAVLPVAIGWRVCFGLGALLGLVVLIVRRHVPESPRWLLLHGYTRDAHAIVGQIEREVGAEPATTPAPTVRIRVSGAIGVRELIHTVVTHYPRRAVLGAVLMLSQAVMYNAIFFSFALVLRVFHGVPAARVGLYIVPVAIGNFLGPFLLGPLFDRLGRRVMVPATYAASGILLAACGIAFAAGVFSALGQTLAWSVVFFVASAAASSAYLTVSELFPVELRGRAIAVFYAFATLVGAGSPALLGRIIDAGDPIQLCDAYLVAAALMIGAAITARVLGVSAERRPLEDLRLGG